MIMKSNETETKVIGVLTSGGDAQGMNAIIRSVVRMSLFKKFKVFLIYEGYNGLIDGENSIQEADLLSADHIIYKGGTIIGSSRCKEFREPDGRIKAALNLIQRNISNLVIIGGDGSLTGANVLKTEWNSIINTLLERGKITEEMKSKNSYLNIIGIVGSIDNDFCGTDMTTGANTALHRIVEAVDAIATTATSHQRAMIIEVMGRNCGYLALVAALALEATFTFIPESPPSENWPEYLCDKVENERKNGRRLNLIIVSEGAIDQNGETITAKQIKKIITDKTKRDVRITILGHIQRGGQPSAFDRILGCRMGAKAVVCLEESTPTTESCVLTINGNQITRKPLMDCVLNTHKVGVLAKNKEWDKCVELRGKSFVRNYETFNMLHQHKPKSKPNGNRFAVIQVGEPCPGMNASVLSYIRYLINERQAVYAIPDGFEGLISGKLKEMKWSGVNGWTGQSGALLGTSKVPQRLTEEQLKQLAKQFKEFQLNGLLIIGGFRAFQLVVKLIQNRKTYPEFEIPFCIIPATIDNNIPGTDFSLGTDSTLNKITQLCTDLLVSSRGTKKRLFIIKLETRNCGYLTMFTALASGADYCYIHEIDYTIDDIKRDANNLKNKMEIDSQNRLIIVNGSANRRVQRLYTKFFDEIYREEGKGVFTTHFVDLKNLQQSLSPSPFDRILGIKMGVKCGDWLMNSTQLKHNENAVVIGMSGSRYLFTNITELIPNTDFEYQIPKDQWFLKLKDLINRMSS